MTTFTEEGRLPASGKIDLEMWLRGKAELENECVVVNESRNRVVGLR